MRFVLREEIRDNVLMRIENRTAHFNYEILEKFEVGIDLLGSEVKSVREGQVSLNESFVHIRNGEMFLVNVHIHPYQHSADKISPLRSRKLLMHKKEIISLASRVNTNGLTLVPIAMYNKGNIFKLEVGIGKGKKKWDKREAIKKKDMQRDIENDLRNKN